MRALLHKVQYTYAEYVAFEASSNVKHEFFDGQIYAMAGGTAEHAALSATFIALLFPQLRHGECQTYNSDLRVHTPSRVATYPDVMVICGPPAYDPNDRLAVTNPTLIVEVTSRSTEEYDRGDKFEHYKSLGSLRQYVLVSHNERSLDVWTRSDDKAWRMTTVREGEVAELTSVGARLDIRELYDAAAIPSA